MSMFLSVTSTICWQSTRFAGSTRSSRAPAMSFHSNSVFAQCNAAVSGLGIALLPTFVGEGVGGLQRILPDEVSVQRDVWVSVRTEQSHLSRIKAVTQFLKYIFAHDVEFLLGKTSRLPAL